VGLAFRIYDRAVACVGAHFAADKHGKERPEARLRVSHLDWPPCVLHSGR
jgi:hypothetical protein